MPVPVPGNQMPDDYGLLLENLKIRIQQERLKAVFSANAALVMMYWDIGSLILENSRPRAGGLKSLTGFPMI